MTENKMASMRVSDSSTDSEYIDAVSNALEFDELFNIADDLGVPSSNINEMDEFKERLLMHLTKSSDGNAKALNAKSMEISSIEDKHKREKLVALLLDLQKVLEKYRVEAFGEPRGTAAIESYLQTEGTVDDLREEMETNIRSLNEAECPFVVAGETSAGKSTLINLMLGQNVLPTSMQSCTSVITKITYGKSLGAEIVYKNGEVRRFRDLTQELLESEVWPIIFVKGDTAGRRETETGVKHVRFEVPSCLLKCGLVLIDSPGIGENEAMDEIIATYVQENFVMGFIYVIKSDSAGGVDEDRLLTLIRVILEKQKAQAEDKTAIQFNPKSAMFICNRWDCIEENQQELVFANAVKKLSKCWPGFSADQIIRMSTTAALREAEVDADFVIEKYRAMLDHTRNIYIVALDTRIQTTYHWVANVINRCLHHVGTIVEEISLSEEENNERTKKVMYNLETLQHKAEVVFLRLRQEIENDTSTLCRKFKDRLQMRSVKDKLLCWEKCELPDAEGKPWPKIKDKLDFKLSQRLSDVLEEWNDENSYILNIEEKIFREVREELNILQDDLDDIEKEVTVCNLSKSLTKSMQQHLHASTPMTSIFGVTNTAPEERCLPLKVMTQAANPVSNILQKVSKTNVVNNLRKSHMEKRYREAPMRTAYKRGDRLWERLVAGEHNNTLLKTIVDSIMQRPINQLTKIEKNIPALIASNKKALEHAFACRLDVMECAVLYRYMQRDFETPAKNIADFGNGYIAITTFRNEELELQEEYSTRMGRRSSTFRSSNLVLNSGSSSTITRVQRGLWTVLQPAKLNTINGVEDITIRMYTRSSGMESTFREIARIKRLNCPYIATLLGIHYSDVPPPVSLFRGNLQNLKVARMRDDEGFTTDIPRILHDVAVGVNYLHRVQMVHMELSVTTVTMDDYRNVKLTGGCFPRHPKLSENNDDGICAEYVYLAPFVLRDHKYISRADIYALGLLMYEIMSQEKPFYSKLLQPLSVFRNVMQIGASIQQEHGFQQLDGNTQNVIESLVNMSVTTEHVCDIVKRWGDSMSINGLCQPMEYTKL